MAAARPLLGPDMPADHLQTLPDEVLVLILSLLSFGEKVGVRLVCRKLKQAVDWMFGQQSSVRIVLRLNIDILMEDCGWESEQMCDHAFDPGYDVCLLHAYDAYDGRAVTADPVFRSEDAKRAMDRFIGSIHFVMKYFHEVSVIAAVCGYMETYFARQKLHYLPEDRIRLKAACGELAARFGSQAKCMTIPMLDVDHSHSFPELVHLTCENICGSITNVFKSVAPKLTALSCQQMHTDNYRNLPHGFRSIRAFSANKERTDSVKLIQQSAGRESIRRIRVWTGSMRDDSGNASFQHLTSLSILIIVPNGLLKFPDYLNATTKRLQRLTLYSQRPADRLPKRLDNLKSLVIYVHGSDRLIQMLGQTLQLQQLHFTLLDQFADQVAVLSAASLLPHLRFVDIQFYCQSVMSPESIAAALTFLRGPLRAHLTFCRLYYGVLNRPADEWDQVQEVMAEMRVMTQTEKLVAGVVNNWFMRRGCFYAVEDRNMGNFYNFFRVHRWL